MNKICKVCDAHCCKSFDYVSIDETEVKRMSKLGAKVHADGDEHLMDVYGGCQFLKGDKCSIYRKRPRACKTWKCEKLWNVDKKLVGEIDSIGAITNQF